MCKSCVSKPEVRVAPTWRYVTAVVSVYHFLSPFWHKIVFQLDYFIRMLNHSQGVTVNGGSLTNIQGDSHSYHGPGAVLTFYTAMNSSKRQLVTKIQTQVQNNG